MAQVLQGTIRSVCGRAAKLGRQNGWCQGTWVNERGERCLVALINRVLGRDDKDELPLAYRLAIHKQLMLIPSYANHIASVKMAYAGNEWVPTNSTIFNWNDASGTTVDEVLGALEAIARNEMPDRDWDTALQALTENQALTSCGKELVSV